MSAIPKTPSTPSFFTRLMQNDSARRGLAAAVSGLLMGTVLELVWPAVRS